MKILRRISVIFAFCSIIASAVCASAQVVQVCDMGAGALVEKSNLVFSTVNNPIRLTDFTHLGKVSEDAPYDIYIATAGAPKDGAAISFFCNNTGFVSKILIMANGKNPAAIRNAGFALAALLISMGLSGSEMNVLMEERASNKPYADVWVAKINRRVILEYKLHQGKNDTKVMAMRLIAVDQ